MIEYVNYQIRPEMCRVEMLKIKRINTWYTLMPVTVNKIIVV